MKWSGSPRVSTAPAPIRNSAVLPKLRRNRPCTARFARSASAIAVVLSGGMVKEGYYFGLPPLAFGAAALLLRCTTAGVILLCLAAVVFYFFRDPARIIPADAGAVVSPAVVRVVVVADEENPRRPGKRISTFLATCA